MRANADVPPLFFDRAVASRRPTATGSNADRAGRKSQTRKLRPLEGCSLRSDHVAAVATILTAGPGHCWQRNLPTSLVRAPLRFASDKDRQLYRKGLRTLALVYAGLLVLVVALTASRSEWRKQELTANATTEAADFVRR